jgi:carnitine O-acetyltransferase
MVSHMSHIYAELSAQVSPDSFIQQALQLAWYKDQGYVSPTSDSRAFVKAMLDPKVEVSYR